MGALLNAHRDLIQAAAGIVGLAVMDKSEHLKVLETTENGDTVIYTDRANPLLFKDIPLGSKAPKKMTLAISFKAVFTAAAGALTISRSNVVASYWTPFRESDPQGQLKEYHRHSHSFHFDYHHFAHVMGGAIHPTHHVQPGDRVIGKKAAPNFRAPAKKVLSSVPTPRVPTPPMDLPAVIEMILADQFPQVINLQTMKPWLTARGQIPRLTPRNCASHAPGRAACCYYDGCLQLLMS